MYLMYLFAVVCIFMKEYHENRIEDNNCLLYTHTHIKIIHIQHMQEPTIINSNHILTIKQQQAIEQILNQISQKPEQESNIVDLQPKLDKDIEQILRQSELDLEREYEQMAEKRFIRNRQAISMEHHFDFEEMLKYGNEYEFVQEEGEDRQNIFDSKAQEFMVDSGSEDHDRKYSTDSFIRYNERDKEDLSDDSSVVSKEEEQPELQKERDEHILDKFQKQKLLRNNKEQEQQILSLDQHYPKINPLPMLKHQYPIFKFTESTTNKYLKYFRYSLQDILQALTIGFNNQLKWTVLAIGDKIIIFPREDWKEPIIYTPQRNKKIRIMAVSPEKKYLTVALMNEIIVYAIRKEDGLILVKHFCQLNITNLSKLIIYQDAPIRIVYVDNEENVGTITIDKTLIFTRVNTGSIQHQLDTVEDMDVLVLQNGTNILALASRDQIGLFSLQPIVSMIQKTKIRERTTKDIKIRWRNNEKLKKPQLFVSFNNKIEIYKLSIPTGFENQARQFLSQLLNLNSQELLVPHLIYFNHYDIIQMEIISQTHLLLRSHQNILVVAIPLIPSSMQIDEEQEESQIFETAIVYISEQRNCRILSINQDEIMFYSDQNPERLKLATLKTLNEYLDELMLHNSLYREAFILLILVHKGVNYSFKFSYTTDQLKNCIYSAIDCTISSILSNMQRQIIQFKVGWICQLAIETKNDNILWGPVFRKLKQKKYLDILFELLELFVLRDQIGDLPEEVFFAFVSYECENGKDSVVEKIIINNRQAYDGSKLIGVIHNKERYYLQFFLFSRGIISDEPDYYTPFIKVFSAFQNYLTKSNSQKAQETGFICLWYIRKCFLFQQIPHGMMTSQEKMNIILNFYIQIMQPTFTKKLADFNLKIFFETYVLPFTRNQLKFLIQQNIFILLHKYHEYFPEIEANYQEGKKQGEIKSEINKQEMKVAEEEEKKRNFQRFYEIILNHLKKSINVKRDPILWTEFAALVFYFTRCNLAFDSVIDMLIILFENKVTWISLELPHEIEQPTLQQVETELILYIKPKLLEKKDRFYMNKLLSFADPNINHILHRIDQNYKLALQHFLATKPINKLIPFIYELLSDINKLQLSKDDEQDESNKKKPQKFLKQRKIADMKEFLVKNINLLFKIDKMEALNIFYAIGQSSQSIYAYIEEHMAEKLNFLTAVLEKFQEEDFDLKQKFMLDHLAEVCTLKDQQMFKYLNKFYYPLDKAIMICEQKNNYLAKAIFQQRSGMITQAFISYEKLVRNLIMNKQVSEKRIRKQVNKYIEECIRLCKLFSGENSSENFWLRIILFINGFIKSNHQQKVFLKVEFERMLQLVLHEMFDFLPTTLLIEFFISKSYKLELSLSKEFSIYSNLFVLIRFDISLALRVIDICKLDVKGNRKQALQSRKNGIICQNQCDFCQNSLDEEEKANLYSCRHSFHSICHDDPFKCLTCYYQSDTSIFSSNIFGKQMRRTSVDYSNQQKEIQNEDTKRKSKKKLKIDAKNLYVDDAYTAILESRRKKMKLFDFKQSKADQSVMEFMEDKEPKF